MKIFFKLLILAVTLRPSLSAQELNTPAPQAKNEVLSMVEVLPKAPYNIRDYLSKNVRYPAKAMESDIQGTVQITFIVEKDGSISTVKANGNRPGGGLTEEAIRVVRAMPKWQPGMNKGVPVRTFFAIPITFKLEDDIIVDKDTTVYRSVQVPAKASYDYTQYISQHLKYRKENKANPNVGKVYVSFIVEKNGSLSHINIDHKGKEMDNQLEEELKRVVSTMPKWTPAQHKGLPVRSYLRMPINIYLR
ncbi:hypothetical protein DBR32_10165 [Taibaiella sp. KBW10]|uniref:energy transducer TonB n=1 Tax=Taibaiella sp. KBW10 TaxID=2153357 RepID=UPI000F5B3BDA|nr:energy transducer TonB [Taibaiella sp. KBW10]RQO31060.1 hypothetical protein DBR32_10165 [Taibaiella sp. KBW10]